jgi:hypothetical protein
MLLLQCILSPLLFWVVMQRRLVVGYQHFRTVCQSKENAGNKWVRYDYIRGCVGGGCFLWKIKRHSGCSATSMCEEK